MQLQIPIGVEFRGTMLLETSKEFNTESLNRGIVAPCTRSAQNIVSSQTRPHPQEGARARAQGLGTRLPKITSWLN